MQKDLISRQMAVDTIMGQPPEPHYPAWYAAQIEELPAVQPDHNADIGKKVEGDCISRQAAIDLFPDDDLEYDTKGGYVAPHLARQIICELPSAQPEQHWIPCSERLPKEKQSVLVTDGSVIWVCDIISTDEGYKWEDSHGYWLDLDEWIAWMKLPELYREGDAE